MGLRHAVLSVLPRRRATCSNRVLFAQQRTHLHQRQTFRKTESRCKWPGSRISKSTMDSPSSNAPMVCPECHPEYAEDQHKAPTAAAASSRKPAEREAEWKYNMRAHWNDRHRNTPMPSGLVAAITLAAGEVYHSSGRGADLRSKPAAEPSPLHLGYHGARPATRPRARVCPPGHSKKPTPPHRPPSSLFACFHTPGQGTVFS